MKNLSELCEIFEVSKADAYKMRIAYLSGQIEALGLDAGSYVVRAYQAEGIDRSWLLRKAGQAVEQIYKHQKERYWLRRTLNGKGGKGHRITDAMIEHAREYPVDKVIEFNRGKAACFNHEDKHPSLTHNKKHNRAHCFVCGKGWDAIAVLQDRDGLSFPEAVRRLT